MKSLLAGASALALLLPVSAFAQAKPDTFVIAKGSYSCKTCTPAFTVKADGSAYPVKGATFDAVAVRLTSNGATEMRMKGGKVVTTINTSVSSDGRTATTDFTDNSGPKPARGLVVSRRVAGSPKGDNPVSGSWEPADFSGAKLVR
jgi:hypothetical protein